MHRYNITATAHASDRASRMLFMSSGCVRGGFAETPKAVGGLRIGCVERTCKMLSTSSRSSSALSSSEFNDSADPGLLAAEVLLLVAAAAKRSSSLATKKTRRASVVASSNIAAVTGLVVAAPTDGAVPDDGLPRTSACEKSKTAGDDNHQFCTCVSG